MSVKIYNGYKLALPCDLRRVCAFLNKVGDKALASAQAQAARVIANMASSAIDKTACGIEVQSLDYDGKTPRELANESAITLARHKFFVRAMRVKKTQERDPTCDLSCEVVVLPSHEGLLAMLYTDNKGLRQVWEARKEVSPWPFWDNSDPPDDVPYEEFRRRGAAWEKALRDHMPPAQAGLTRTLVPEGFDGSGFLSAADASRRQPSLRARARAMASDVVLQRRVDESKPPEKEKGAEDAVSMILEAGRWMGSADGKKALADEVTRVTALLKPRHSVEDYRRPLRDWAPGG